MSFIKKILETDVISHPWSHQIVTNFLETEDFLTLRSQCENIFTDYCLKQGDSLQHPISLIQLKQQISEEIYYTLWEYNKQLLQNCKQLLKLYPTYRHFKNYLSIPSFYFMDYSAGFHQIHDETEDKALSIVLYISPDSGTGTNLYRSSDEKSFVTTVRWSPNKALIFCGIKSVTWHNFGTVEDNRITMNFFLRETNLTDAVYYVDNDILYFKKNGKIIKQLPFDKDTAELIDLHSKGYLMF